VSGIHDSNLFAAQFDVVRPQVRSSAAGVMLAFGFLVGAAGPWLLGLIKQTHCLTFEMASLSVAYGAATDGMFLALKRFFPRDHIPPQASASDAPS